MFTPSQCNQKRTKKRFFKNEIKNKLLKIAPDILKFANPVWLKLDQLKKREKNFI